MAALRVLVDLRPRLLADAVASGLRGRGIVVDLVGPEDGVFHDDSRYDLVVVGEDVRAARPGRLTARVTPDDPRVLGLVLDVLGRLRDHQPSADQPAAS